MNNKTTAMEETGGGGELIYDVGMILNENFMIFSTYSYWNWYLILLNIIYELTMAFLASNDRNLSILPEIIQEKSIISN